MPGAATLAVAAAMVGIVSGGLIGGPIGTWLIARHRLPTPRERRRRRSRDAAQHIVEDQIAGAGRAAPAGEDRESYLLLKTLAVMLLAMWIGGGISAWLKPMLARHRAGAAGLHRRDARGGGHPEPGRLTGWSGCRSAPSTTSATSRCRCSWSWR